ncbi:MAG: HAD family phosphatase [Planctomycetota bacterium]|nr:HAD family phosphatase [Planctomycetota bacterium]
MDALIFDFDGVVVDSEPIHLACFRHVLASRGLQLTREDYYGKYLGYDDHDCFLAALHDQGASSGEQEITKMIAEKSALVKEALSKSIEPMPGAVELIRSAADQGLPVAVCSGALRQEIELAAQAVGVRDCFATIISAEDVPRGKPDPAGYVLAARKLAELLGRAVRPGRCVVIEDSPAGIDAAHAAGMKVLAVTNSYPRDVLAAADKIVDSLVGTTAASLEELL